MHPMCLTVKLLQEKKNHKVSGYVLAVLAQWVFVASAVSQDIKSTCAHMGKAGCRHQARTLSPGSLLE